MAPVLSLIPGIPEDSFASHALKGSRLMTTDENDPQISRDSDGQEPAHAAPGRIDPVAMTVAQAAKILSAVGVGTVTEDLIRRHIAAGAPATADGRINLMHYAAWLNKDSSEDHGD